MNEPGWLPPPSGVMLAGVGKVARIVIYNDRGVAEFDLQQAIGREAIEQMIGGEAAALAMAMKHLSMRVETQYDPVKRERYKQFQANVIEARGADEDR